MIVSLFRPGFYAAEHDPAVPTVIFDGDTVRDATPAALDRGVQVGGGLADAKAILREDGQYVAVDMAQARRRAATWWRALLAYSDLIVVRSPAEALVDLRAHPDPREVAGEMARAVRRSGPGGVAMGLARAAWMADAVRVEVPPDALDLGVYGGGEVEACELARWPVDWLTELTTEERDRLKLLGYRRLGVVAQLPLPALTRAVGKRAWWVQQLAQGTDPGALKPNYPPEAYTERWDFGAGCEDRMALELAGDEMAHRLALRLARHDRMASTLWLTMTNEEGQTVTYRRQLAKPVAQAHPLRVFYRQVVDRGLPWPPVRATLSLPRLQGAKRVQRQLDQMVGSSERQDAAETARARVVAAMGVGTIKRACEIEISRRERWLRQWSDAIGWS